MRSIWDCIHVVKTIFRSRSLMNIFKVKVSSNRFLVVTRHSRSAGQGWQRYPELAIINAQWIGEQSEGILSEGGLATDFVGYCHCNRAEGYPAGLSATEGGRITENSRYRKIIIFRSFIISRNHIYSFR